jgi:hypothetical protein
MMFSFQNATQLSNEHLCMVFEYKKTEIEIYVCGKRQKAERTGKVWLRTKGRRYNSGKREALAREGSDVLRKTGKEFSPPVEGMDSIICLAGHGGACL